MIDVLASCDDELSLRALHVILCISLLPLFGKLVCESAVCGVVVGKMIVVRYLVAKVLQSPGIVHTACSVTFLCSRLVVETV